MFESNDLIEFVKPLKTKLSKIFITADKTKRKSLLLYFSFNIARLQTILFLCAPFFTPKSKMSRPVKSNKSYKK